LVRPDPILLANHGFKNMSLSHEQVQDLLPHRYPFLFVDKVTKLKSGYSVEGTFRIKTDHPYINRVGGVSVFPATLVVEALGQLAALCIRYDQGKPQPRQGAQGFLVRIDECSFAHPVHEEEELLLTASLVKQYSTLYKFDARGFVDHRIVVQASLTLYLEF
jgi:3-hydroxyacyl-[acyl-carrier-protein] dehydratase